MVYSENSNREREIGIEVFYTSTKGTGGRLKVNYEDFIVDEVSVYPERTENGRYAIAKITSTNWETNRLVRMISKNLGITRNKITFAGTKDKRAVTSQLFSIEAPVEAVQALSMHQVKVEDVYASKKHITIGDLVGNTFKIKLRNTELKGEELAASVAQTGQELEALGGFPNFFGVQRFGSIRPVTHLVGKHIVHGDFERAVMMYIGNPNDEEDDSSRLPRQRLQETMDLEAAMQEFPRTLTFERMLIGWVLRNPGDWSGAIRTLPPNLQMMFVHAYQSYLFNLILSERIRRGIPLDRPVVGDVVLPADRTGYADHDKPVPVTKFNLDLVEKSVREHKAFVSGVLFGSESKFAEGEMGEIERKVIETEGVRLQDFIVPQIAECNSRGSRRELVSPFKDLKLQCSEESVDLAFTLGKGCYATVMLREYMKSDLLDY
jgi:tRNA pseudouridine13 synthase